MTTPPPTLLASLVERKPCDGIEAEIAAWDWLETKFGTEEDDSVDRAYAADEMVDAFHAGTDWRFKRAAAALEALAAENGALREALETIQTHGRKLARELKTLRRATLNGAHQT